jgi:hypothetical protein
MVGIGRAGIGVGAGGAGIGVGVSAESAAAASPRSGSMLRAIANCAAAASGFDFDSKSLPAAKWATYRLSRKSSAEGGDLLNAIQQDENLGPLNLAPRGIELTE